MSKLWRLAAAAVCTVALAACGANKSDTPGETAPTASATAAAPQPTPGKIDDLCTKFRAISIPQIEEITGETVTEAEYSQGENLGGSREMCAFSLSAPQVDNSRYFQFVFVSVDVDPHQKLWKKISRKYVTETSGFGDEALTSVPGRGVGITFRKGQLVVEVSFSNQKDTPEAREWARKLAAQADANLA